MSKPSPPPPPNPYAVANAQTGTNIGTAIASQTLANTNQVTPYGTTTYDRTGGYTDPTTGQWVPQYTQTTALNPTEQQIFSGTENAGFPDERLHAERAHRQFHFHCITSGGTDSFA